MAHLELGESRVHPVVKIPQDIIGGVVSFIDRFPSHVIFENDDILIVDKPAGIAVSDPSHFFTPDLKGIIEDLMGIVVNPGNRLDRDTSGLTTWGKSKKGSSFWGKAFSRRQVKKEYLALVDGTFDPALSGVIAPLAEVEGDRSTTVAVSLEPGSKQAGTKFEVLANFIDGEGVTSSLLKVRILHGRTHQIRAHLKHAGYPLLGDSTYNDLAEARSRQLLHAWKMTFTPSGAASPVTVTARLPKDMADFIERQTVMSGDYSVNPLLSRSR